MIWRKRNRNRVGLVVGALGLLLSFEPLVWAEEKLEEVSLNLAPVEEGEDPRFLVAGTFKSAFHSGLLGQLSNYVFEYENDEDLFRDFGDLGIGVGGDFGTFGVNFDFIFRNRVVSILEAIPP